MPIVFTYDAESITISSSDRTRIHLAFQRLGWEPIGGSAYRYPRLTAGTHPSEDWFNHVIPALMFFRAMIEKRGISVPRYSLEAHSSVGSGSAGADIVPSSEVKMYMPKRGNDGGALAKATKSVLTFKRLRKWLADICTTFPGGS